MSFVHTATSADLSWQDDFVMEYQGSFGSGWVAKQKGFCFVFLTCDFCAG